MHHRSSLYVRRSQNRQPIQTLEEARDAVQALHVGRSYICTGSVDGHVRTYDLRMGELRSDFIGSTPFQCIYALAQPSHPSYASSCDCRRSIARQPDLPCDDARCPHPPHGHVHRQDAERLQGPRQCVISHPRVFWPRRSERCVWRRGRKGVGMGSCGCAFVSLRLPFPTR